MKNLRIVLNAAQRYAPMTDPESKAVFERWRWNHIYPPGTTVNEATDWTLRAVEPLINALRTPELDVVLAYWGQVPSPWGLLTVANTLLGNHENVARFYIEPIECLIKGPGYVQTLLNIEYMNGFMDLLIHKAHGAFGGGMSCLSFYFVPTEHFNEAVHSDLVFAIDRPKLTSKELHLLEVCPYILLLGVDSDVITAGANGSHGEKLLAVLKDLWPEAVYGER